MIYEPLSEKDLAELRPSLAPGIYSFQVMHAKETKSEAGNPMIILTLKIWDKNGREFRALDYLVSHPSMVFKIKHFWEAVGEPQSYNGENEDYHFISKCGNVKTKNERYKEMDKIKVVDYVSETAKEQEPARDPLLPGEAANNDHLKINDDIPF